MVQMQALAPSSIAVTVEVGGGIRNPACQDAIEEGYYRSTQDCQPIPAPNNKSTEQLTIQSTSGTSGEDVVDSAGAIGSTRSAREKIMNACRSLAHWRYLTDGAIILSVIALLAVVELGVIPQSPIGFYCNDPKISHKFTGDTITMVVLLSGSIGIPLIVMWTTEWLCHKPESYRETPGCTGSRGKQIWFWYGHYALGIIAVTFICELMKIIMAEPRPHFLDTCKPMEMTNCTVEYVQHSTCTNTKDPTWFILDSSKSFPSGHSALSVYTSIFLAWYVQVRIPSRLTTIILKPWLQCVILLWGTTCSLTRISDHRHHWWDVLAGVSFGIIFAIFSVKIFCSEFSMKEGGLSRALSEPTENGHIGFEDKRHPSIKKLLSNTSVNIPEGRELGNVSSTWK